MAKARVVHDDDGVTVVFEGDRRRPEPSTAVVKFPGGHIEVSRCSDGTYWAHLAINHRGVSGWTDGDSAKAGRIVDSRVDRVGGPRQAVTDMDDAGAINHMALRVAVDKEAAA